jgi:hypothetical protein
MLQLSSLAAYINNNTEWLRVGVRGYVIDCLHAPIVSINHYQNVQNVLCGIHVQNVLCGIIDISTILFTFFNYR